MPDPNEQIPVILFHNEWGQIIDGLTCRAEDYEMTARYFETGCFDDVIERVPDGMEAQSLPGASPISEWGISGSII